jgi:hypothetical protein
MGEGVDKSIIRQAIKQMADNVLFWTNLDNMGQRTFAVLPITSSTERLARVKAHGTLVALHMLWLGLAPFPISAWMILLAIEGPKSIYDLDFIRSINPETASELEGWPLDPSAPLTNDASLLLSNHLSISVCLPLHFS